MLATARDVTALASLRDHGPHVAVGTLDVREPRQCADAVSLAVEQLGGVDVLVNNAGYGQFGVVEEVSDAELAAQFDTNGHRHHAYNFHVCRAPPAPRM